MTLKPTIYALSFILLAALTSVLFADTVKAPSPAEISQLIAQLGDDDCMVRDNAQKTLMQCGGVVKTELEKALATVEDPEIYQRLQFILQTIPVIWDEPGDDPTLTEFIHLYRKANTLSRMLILEELRQLPMDIQIKALDRIFQKEQNSGTILFAAIAFWYWRPAADSPEYAQITHAVNELWKDSKIPAVKNLYYLVNYKKVRPEATLWFDNQLHNITELNRYSTKSPELVPEYIGAILTEFARRQAESLMTDAELAGAKRIKFPAPRYGSSATIIVNGVIQNQFSIRSQIFSSVRNSLPAINYSERLLIPILGPIYLLQQGMSQDAEAWLTWEFSSQGSTLSILDRSRYAELIHEYGLNKAAADLLEQKNSFSSSSGIKLSDEYIGRVGYFRACQAKQENKPDKQWEFLCNALKANNTDLDCLIMQWELCQVPAKENKIAAITDEVRKKVDESIEELLSDVDEGIVDSGMSRYSQLNQYAWLAVKTNRHLDKALDYAKQAVASEPDSSACLDTLAHCYAAGGDVDKAIELQQKAVKMDPASPVLYDNLLNFKKLKEKE